MSRKNESDGSSSLGKWVLILLGVLFVGSIIWSFLYETLLPLWAAGDVGGVVRHLAGFPIILAGTAIFAYGGYVLVRNTFGAMADPQLQENVATIDDEGTLREDKSQARWENARFLLRAWKAGAVRMALGFGLIAVGGWLIKL